MSVMEAGGAVAEEIYQEATTEVGGLRFVTMRADLMPDEVIVARRVEALRRKVVIALGALIVVIAAGYVASWLQTRSVQGDLDDLNRSNTALQNQQAQFGPLVTAQTDSAAVQSQLATLMVGDLPWSSMLGQLRTQAPTGVTLTTIAGTVTSSTSGGSSTVGSANLNQSGKQAVGTLTLSGAAGTKSAIAAYSDRLARTKGLTAPLITNVATVADGVTFTMTVTITTDALGGRFTPTTTTTTGTTGTGTTGTTGAGTTQTPAGAPAATGGK